MATIQWHEVTHEQTSTLFWINVAFGLTLAVLRAVSAPLLVAFYTQPRIYWITVISGATFVFTGLAAQHWALLQRGMRFVTQANIGILALLAGSATGIVMALFGFQYWSLVGMAMATSVATTGLVWVAVPSMPGPPRRGSGVGAMLRFGGVATLNSFVVFVAWNARRSFWAAFGVQKRLDCMGAHSNSSRRRCSNLNGLSAG